MIWGNPIRKEKKMCEINGAADILISLCGKTNSSMTIQRNKVTCLQCKEIAFEEEKMQMQYEDHRNGLE